MIPIILIFNLILLVFDIPLFLFSLLLSICIASRLVWKNKESSFFFFSQFLINGILELLFIGLEYFLVRVPLYGIFNEGYISLGVMPGLIYGFSVYLPVTIVFGQFLIALNRFFMIKFPFTYTKFVNLRVMVISIIFQFLLPSILLIWSFNQNIQASYTYDNSSTVIESTDDNYTMNSVLICIIMCVFWSIVNVILSALSIYFLTKVNRKMNEKSKEKPLLTHSCIQTTAQTFLAIVASLQYISFVTGDQIMETIAMHLYPFAEDAVSLSSAIVLFCVCKQVREQFLDFYHLRWLWEKYETKFTNNSKQTIKASANSIDLV
uniref:Serpentine Receptor, class T n=1 Tax=Strongyloides papillosus TaxID=174720 RepID=A0A0N5BNG2_STREA